MHLVVASVTDVEFDFWLAIFSFLEFLFSLALHSYLNECGYLFHSLLLSYIFPACYLFFVSYLSYISDLLPDSYLPYISYLFPDSYLSYIFYLSLDFYLTFVSYLFLASYLSFVSYRFLASYLSFVSYLSLASYHSSACYFDVSYVPYSWPFSHTLLLFICGNSFNYIFVGIENFFITLSSWFLLRGYRKLFFYFIPTPTNCSGYFIPFSFSIPRLNPKESPI